MPALFGRQLGRTELLRRVGRLDQVAGVRLVTLGDGAGRGVRLLEFRTGTGFAFDVVVDRTFDIGRCELGGTPLAWIANPGTVGPWFYENDAWGWFRAWGGGMVVTCGLDHTLGPGEDSAEAVSPATHPHEAIVRSPRPGRRSPRAARGLRRALGGRRVRPMGGGRGFAVGDLRRAPRASPSVEARVGESRFTIHDVVENVGHHPTSHMFLYHCNVGFPVVDEGSRLLVPRRALRLTTACRSRATATLSGPDRGTSPRRASSTSSWPSRRERCRWPLVNDTLGVGSTRSFRIDQLAHHTVWRMMGEDTYALAMEPWTNRDAGRWDARERGELLELDPGETCGYDLEIGALADGSEIAEFERRVTAIMPAVPA